MSHELSNYAFNRYGADAKLYNGIHDLETRAEQQAALVKELKSLAQEMAGYVWPYGLSDKGAKSDFDSWKTCRDRIEAIARADGTKGEDSRLSGTTKDLARE